MLQQFTRLLGVLSLGLASGIALGVFLMLRNWSDSARLYVELMQLLARVLTVPAPILGLLALATIATDSAFLYRREPGAALMLALCSFLLSLAALALTKLGHFPLNDQIATWNPSLPPADWAQVRTRWLSLHKARTFCSIASFALYILSNLLRR